MHTSPILGGSRLSIHVVSWIRWVLFGGGTLILGMRLWSAEVEGVADRFVADYERMRPSQAIRPGLTPQEAREIQAAVVRKLSKRWGAAAGYKAGAVTREAQRRLGVNEPVRGVMLRRMLLPDDSILPARCGVKPVAEADLILTVKDAGINEAQTVEDVARHLRDVVAFIEIPDSVLVTNPPPDVQSVIASNVGARWGVLGERRRWKNTPEYVRALGEMELSLKDGAGKTIASDKASELYGHPLKVVLWLVEDMRKNGVKLRRGDVLSLGAVKMVAPKANETVVLEYSGLPGGPLRARVRFTAEGQ